MSLIKPPPSNAPIAGEGGVISRSWRPWFQDLARFFGTQPIPLASFSISNVPDAAFNTGCIIYVTNEAGGAVPAFSDGTNWRRVTDRNIIS